MQESKFIQNQYKVSIIIPHYNSPALLEKLLSTIPDREEIQTIVIDDHSPEEVKEQIRTFPSKYAGKNILLLENTTLEHNAGATRNIGLKYVEGKWLLFADADDYFLDGFFEVIKNYFDSDYDIVFFPPTSIQLDTGKEDIRHLKYADYVKYHRKRPNINTEAQLRYLWLTSQSKLMRTSLVKQNHLEFESGNVSEDAIFSIQAGLYAKKISASEKIICCFTRSAGSLTTKQDLTSFDTSVQEMVRRFHFLKSHLSKKEFRASEAYKLSISQLFAILQRRYGMGIFIKYFKLFKKNHMLIFDLQILKPINIRRGIQKYLAERAIKKRYQ